MYSEIPHQTICETNPSSRTKITSETKIAVFSDSLPLRNGVSAYWHDLILQIRPRLGGIHMFEPVDKRRFLQFGFPLPGDPTQKIITPNIVRIWNQFNQLKPDLIVAVSPGPFGLLGLVFAEITNTELVTVFHTHFEAATKRYWSDFKYALIYTYFLNANRILCQNSNTVYTTTSELTDTIKSLKAKRVKVAGTPLSLIFLDTPLAPPPERLKHVIFAGRLAPEKNLNAIVRAATKLPELDFSIIGEGPLWGQMKKRANRLDNLTLNRWMSRKELIKQYDAADLLILPSHEETFGTVALEAMSRGRPALVSQSAGIHDWAIFKDALLTIPSGGSLTGILRELMQKKATFWEEKSLNSRKAALQLNEETIDQWVKYTDSIHHDREPARV